MSREIRHKAKIEKEQRVAELIDELHFKHFNFIRLGDVDETKYAFAMLGYKSDLENTDLSKFGVIWGTGIGGIQSFEDEVLNFAKDEDRWKITN